MATPLNEINYLILIQEPHLGTPSLRRVPQGEPISAHCKTFLKLHFDGLGVLWHSEKGLCAKHKPFFRRPVGSFLVLRSVLAFPFGEVAKTQMDFDTVGTGHCPVLKPFPETEGQGTALSLRYWWGECCRGIGVCNARKHPLTPQSAWRLTASLK